MPNWVFNELTINAKNKEDIDQIENLLAKPYVTKHKSHFFNEKTNKVEEKIIESVEESSICFWNIVKPDESILDEYFEIADSSTVDNPNNWYNWNVKNWGTKWDACEDYCNRNSDNLLSYSFNTAWSPPIPFVESLAKQFPHLEILLSYEEETGWGGRMEFNNGQLIEENEYPEPENNDDYDENGFFIGK